MGNTESLGGQRPPVKSPSFNKCSDGVWDDTIQPTPTESITEELKSLNAYIDLSDTFCVEVDKDITGNITVVGQGRELIEQVCTNIGDPGEWKPYKVDHNNCNCNACQQGYKANGPLGVYAGCAVVPGGTTSCARVAFNADPLVCCFNDYACDQKQEKCFQTPEQQLTCDPNFRDLSNVKCRNIISDYCTGEKLFPGQTDWLEMWLENSQININSGMELSTDVYPSTFFNPVISVSERGKKYPFPDKQPCLRAIARNVTVENICSWDELQEGEVITSTIDPDGLNWAREIIDKVYNKYTSESGQSLLNGINTDGINKDSSFYNTLWNLCNKIPLLCTNGSDEFPEGILPNLCNKVTVETLKKNPDTIKWCGCHMQPSQYTDYTDKYGITRECTPMCNRPGVIPTVDVNGERNFCLQSTCVLDDNNIDITNSEIKGGVNFNQICSGCGKSNVNRNFKRVSGNRNNTSPNSYDSYTIKNPPPPKILTSYYSGIYGGGYSRSNFSGNSLFLNVLYTPTNEESINKYYKNQTSIQSIPDKDYQKYITDKKIPISSMVCIFGIKDQTDCVGVVNVGFKILSSAILPPNFLDTECLILYSSQLVDIGNGQQGYKPLVFDPQQKCQNSQGESVTLFDSGITFQKVSTKTYSDNIVSESQSKFNSGSANSQVSSNTCTCIMQNYTLKSINSVVDGSINFSQECGKSKCYDSSGNLISCASTSENSSTHDTVEEIERKTIIQEEDEKYTLMFYILFGFCIFLLILWFFSDLRK